MDWDTVISITKEFRFDAAHFLPTAPKGHPNSRMHGHSFAVALTLEGAPDPVKGWIRSFAEVDDAVASLRDRLDHHLLNEVPGLELPTLERMSHYIYSELVQRLPELVSVTVRRDSLGESATFRRP
ncbi:MAG: 6-carboxytetrahydropterin synthase [Micropepsaceae bacterium]